MHAKDFCILPAEGIYDKEAIASIADVANRCHIYLIGYTPRVNLGEVKSADGKLLLHFEVLGSRYVLDYDLPEGLRLLEEDGSYFLSDSEGRRYFPDQVEIQSRLNHESKAINFEVKYIGQAYGNEGSRSAVDRLLKHEKLQMIALKGAPEGYRITLLLLSIETRNQLFTVINPFAKDLSAGEDRIRQGLDKLFNTTEEERISLYEAALIRYFYPDFNKEFKDSFPRRISRFSGTATTRIFLPLLPRFALMNCRSRCGRKPQGQSTITSPSMICIRRPTAGPSSRCE